MSPLFHNLLSDDLHIYILSNWLDIRSLSTLDVAVSSNTLRPYWMSLLHSISASVIDDWDHNLSSMTWLTRRRICSSRLHIMSDNYDVKDSDLAHLQTINLMQFGD